MENLHSKEGHGPFGHNVAPPVPVHNSMVAQKHINTVLSHKFHALDGIASEPNA